MQQARLAIIGGFDVARRDDRSCGSSAGVSASAYRIEHVAPRDLGLYRAPWADLFERALEANVFLDPAFALPLMHYVAPGRRPGVVMVWETNERATADVLIALFPVALPRVPILGQARGFTDKQACLGTPLLDRDRGRAAFAAILDWLATHRSRPSALTLTDVPADGLFMRAIVGELSPARRPRTLSVHRRAVLLGSGASGTDVASLESAKTRKERKRQRRRLAEHGTRTYVSARTPDEIARATERFLTLERKGWKGARGTALLATDSLAAFARATTTAMALEAKCRIDALEINGVPVAMGIVLISGNRAHFWKTTFDEDLARLSPGVQFATDLTAVQLAEPATTLTDSCAIPDHPMIDRLWPDRLELVDFALPLKAAGSIGVAASLGLEHLRRRARRWTKIVYLFLRKRRTLH